MTRMHGIFQKALKNRSSKDLRWFTGPGFKDILRKVSGTQLKDWANREVRGAERELKRRLGKNAKKEGKSKS